MSNQVEGQSVSPNDAKPVLAVSLPPTVDEIAEAANNYLGLNSGMTYEDMVAAGHFVAGVTWAIEKMTGGNDR